MVCIKQQCLRSAASMDLCETAWCKPSAMPCEQDSHRAATYSASAASPDLSLFCLIRVFVAVNSEAYLPLVLLRSSWPGMRFTHLTCKRVYLHSRHMESYCTITSLCTHALTKQVSKPDANFLHPDSLP